MKKIAIIHPEWCWGGCEAVSSWVVEGLKEKYDITIITSRNFSVNKANSFFGTQLRPGDIRILHPPPSRFLKEGGKLWLLKQHLTMRYCKSIASNFDLLFSTSNEMDFGCVGIQYIHFPTHAEKLIQSLDQFPKKWYYKDSFLREGYRSLCWLLSGFSLEAMKQNITLVNSEWTGKMVEKAYGIKSRTVYPPVAADIPETRWSEKEDGFVCIGRISSEKRIERIIDILSFVRKEGLNVHLHIIGPATDSRYNQVIKHMQQKNSSWIFMEGVLDRKVLHQLIAQHKYGIHGMENEHFGIAVAEMVKAGCIVFVPNGGGQIEIVGNELLTYRNVQEAVEKILSVLGSAGLQSSLQEHLSLQARHFSACHFVRQIRQILGEVLQ
jgi:glycosyltransferase involved in cell wall biosynthesis